MELCSGQSPASPALRNIRGIPVPVSPAFPPIEEWYIVAHRANGESRIFKSWEKYQIELSSITFENGGPPELAAFPTMAQAITQLEKYSNVQRKLLEPSPSLSKLTDTRTVHRSSNGGSNMLAGLPPHISEFTAQDPNDHIATTAFIDALVSNRLIAGSLLNSMPQTNSNAVAPPTRVSNDAVDRDTRKGSTLNVPKSLSRSLLSSENERNARKRKSQTIPTAHGITIPSVPTNKIKIPTVPTSMTARSIRADMDDRNRNQVDTSSLDALAMAANDSNSRARSSPSVMGTFVNPTSASTIANKRRISNGAQLSPTSIIKKRGATGSIDPRGIPSSNPLAVFPNPITGRLNGRSDSFTVANSQKSLSTTLQIPTVPTALPASLRIPEVPRGFSSPANQDSLNRTIQDLQSSMENRSNLMASSHTLASQKLASQKLAMSAVLAPASSFDFYSQSQQPQSHPLFNCQFPPHGAPSALSRNNSLYPHLDEFRQMLELSSLCGSDGGFNETTLKRQNTSTRQW